MVFGDSNTHGTRALARLDDLDRFDAATRWPGVMAAALGTGWQIIEEGQPGRTTTHDDPVSGAHKNGLTVLPALLESHRPLDAVIVMLGTNDLKARFALMPFDIAESAARLLRTVAHSTAGPAGAAPKRLLIAPVPILEAGLLAETFTGGAAKAQRLALHFETAAEACGAGFLDAASCGGVDPLDGVHLPPATHAALGAAAARALTALCG